MKSSNEVRSGDLIEIDGNLVSVLNYHHNKTGRGGAVIKLKIKNLNNNSITEYTCRPGEKFKEADVEKIRSQFQYQDGDMSFFMDMNTYEQIAIHQDDLGDASDYLAEDVEVFISFWNSAPVSVQLPPSVDLKVAETEPGVKGDTVSGATKPAKMETGITINVPLFVEEGEVIKVDTRNGEYLERVK
jgi:elongation factor P